MLFCYSESKQCYTWTDGDRIIRGCVGDKFIPSAVYCSNPRRCVICDFRFNCNKQQVLLQKCHRNHDKSCSTALVNMGCYQFKYDNETINGCISELTNKQYADCLNSNDCKICFEDYCNN